MRLLLILFVLALSLAPAEAATVAAKSGAGKATVPTIRPICDPLHTIPNCRDLFPVQSANAAPTAAAPAAKPDLLSALNQITIADLSAAVAIFTAFNNVNGKACASAWVDLLKANESADATQLPEPHLFADLAKLYNLHVAMASGAPLKTACAAMKDDLSSGLLGGLGGIAAITKLTPVLALFGL